MAVVNGHNPLFIEQEHLAQPHGADRNHIKIQQNRINNLKFSGFRRSPALAHHLCFLREGSVTPDRPPSSGLPPQPPRQFFDDPSAFIQSIWDNWTSGPRDLDDLSDRLEKLSYFLCQRRTFSADHLLDRNFFHVVVDVIRDFPNANPLDLALQCLEGATCCQSTLCHLLMDDEICF
jgi:hypothetical protein